jgi:hypothetical protein
MDHSASEQKQGERWRKIARGEWVAMIRQSLQRRLERLEEVVLPVETEATRIEIHFHNAQGIVTSTKVIEIPGYARTARIGRGTTRLRHIAGRRRW